MKIKVNDQVKIRSGKEKGKTGKVTQVFASENKLVVEGANTIKKHLRAKSKTEPGQIIELFAPLASGKVMLVCPKCQKTARVGYTMEAGKKKRRCSACKAVIE